MNNDEIETSYAKYISDDNPNTYFEAKGKFPHKNPWIQIEFYRESLVSYIEITNCKDCDGYTLPNLYVQVGDSKAEKSSIDPNNGNVGLNKDTYHECGQYISKTSSKPIAGTIVTIPCDHTSQLPGKFLTMQVVPGGHNDTRLILGEVDVYGLNSVAGNSLQILHLIL